VDGALDARETAEAERGFVEANFLTTVRERNGWWRAETVPATLSGAKEPDAAPGLAPTRAAIQELLEPRAAASIPGRGLLRVQEIPPVHWSPTAPLIAPTPR
jgi:hypothetical protein